MVVVGCGGITKFDVFDVCCVSTVFDWDCAVVDALFIGFVVVDDDGCDDDDGCGGGGEVDEAAKFSVEDEIDDVEDEVEPPSGDDVEEFISDGCKRVDWIKLATVCGAPVFVLVFDDVVFVVDVVCWGDDGVTGVVVAVVVDDGVGVVVITGVAGFTPPQTLLEETNGMVGCPDVFIVFEKIPLLLTKPFSLFSLPRFNGTIDFAVVVENLFGSIFWK